MKGEKPSLDEAERSAHRNVTDADSAVASKRPVLGQVSLQGDRSASLSFSPVFQTYHKEGSGRVPPSVGFSGCDSRWRPSGSELVGRRGVSIAGFGEGCDGVLGEVATVRYGPFVVEV